MRKHVISRFLAVFIPVFVMVTGASLFWLTKARVNEAENLLAARIGTQIARAASGLDGQKVNADPASARAVLAPLLSDPAIVCADILVNGASLKGAEQPRRLGCSVMASEDAVSVPVAGLPDARLRVGFNRDEIRAIRSEAVSAGLFNALLAVLVAAAIGVLAFRLSVGNPVRRLLETVRMVTKDGVFRHAAVGRRDEIGELCEAFNGMQDRLEAEQKRTNAALDRIDHMYNATPALLFTLSADGVVTSVSDHWLAESGYARQEVAGKPLEHFICLDSRTRLKSSVLHELRQGSQLREVPMRLWCKNGAEIDVLLSTMPDRRARHGADFICVMNDVTLLRSAERSLRSLALTDPLTSLPNRLGLADYMASCKARTGAVMFIDLDNFKTINDTYGHNAGDKALLESASRIRGVIGDAGLVARLGGDEFAVMLPEMTGRCEAAAIAEKIVERLCVPIILEHSTGHIGASVGIAICADAGRGCDEALRQADQAMYVAKNEGKNRYAFYHEEAAQEITTRALQVQLIQNGLEQNWFGIVFQPIIGMSSMQPVALEALLRLNRADCPFKSTEEIIQVAEESGQMIQLGDWILNEACSRFLAMLDNIRLSDLYLTVNLSPRQLTEGFVHKVRRLLHEKPVLAGKLVFEVTETAAIRRFDVVESLLSDLRAAGARIAIDDFGSGYSSLSYIGRLPVDMLKLDKSFVQMAVSANGSAEGCRKQLALMRTMATLGRELGLEIIAEGLETAESIEFVKDMGIGFGQGYVFAQPMEAGLAAEWLDKFASGSGGLLGTGRDRGASSPQAGKRVAARR